jgi:ABC-type antimicrobial peptide transport system permease subunit
VPIVAYGQPDEEMREAAVVGVVEDVRYVTSARQSQPEVFYLYRQMGRQLPVETVTILVRTEADAAFAPAALRAAVRDADSQLVVEAVMPLEQRLRATIARPRLYAIIIAAFAGSALAIAAVGLFGLASYVVSLRSRELAIRAAIGAGRTAIAGLVLRQGLTLVFAGIVVGMLTSAFAAQALAAQLYGISTHDALTFCAVPVVILIIAGIACLGPARRAATLDVVRVLRGGL